MQCDLAGPARGAPLLLRCLPPPAGEPTALAVNCAGGTLRCALCCTPLRKCVAHAAMCLRVRRCASWQTHRLPVPAPTVQVPLSDGRITPEGKLECPYVSSMAAANGVRTCWCRDIVCAVQQCSDAADMRGVTPLHCISTHRLFLSLPSALQHGWQFKGCGTCTSMPQGGDPSAPRSSATACEPGGGCLQCWNGCMDSSGSDCITWGQQCTWP